jgi:hypothetical protein
MARFLAYLLTTLILLQAFSRELLVLDYQAHKARITELFCVNKAKPQLQCNGRCHLSKKLRQATESKAPATGFAQVKIVLAPLALQLLRPRQWPLLGSKYAPPTGSTLRFCSPNPHLSSSFLGLRLVGRLHHKSQLFINQLFYQNTLALVYAF